MIKINVVAVGKLKEKFFSLAAEEYIKRLSRYCDMKITEISAVKLPENPSAAQIESAILKEAEAIKKHIQNGKVIALCVEGESLSSEAFSEVIKDATISGTPLNFVIGGSYGLHADIKALADKKLSFSEMTFPHRLFRVMCLEQIYRAFKIIEGGTYHK